MIRLLLLVGFLALVGAREGQKCSLYDLSFNGPQLNGPAHGEDPAEWYKQMLECRAASLDMIGYNGGAFRYGRLNWTQSAFAVPMVQGYDRFLYDGGNWTVDRLLDDLKERYGGADAVLLWPTYTNLGIDDRNQLDMYRSLPGGLDAVRKATQQFHAAGVEVLWSFNPWDTGTRNETRGSNATGTEAFVRILADEIADGINGDTLSFVPEDWWNASLADDWPIAFEPEGGGSVPSLNWETMSVCHCKYTELSQTVDHYKWLESRRMTSVRDRWSKDHTDALHFAWFNAVGFETTESNWGTWNGITPRDGETIRRAFTALRFFVRRGVTVAPGVWRPHAPGAINQGVFVSQFTAPNATLWLLVNRANASHGSGPQLNLPPSPRGSAYDCWRGAPLAVSDNGTVSFELDARGFGCVYVAAAGAGLGADPDLAAFLATMARLTERGPISAFSSAWTYLEQEMVPHSRTAPINGTQARGGAMVRVPGAAFRFATKGVEDQGTDAFGGDTQFPWESSPRLNHPPVFIPVEEFWIDSAPVVAAAYAEYLESTQYAPADPYRFLHNWNGSRTAPAALADRPVTYVSMREAREYCAWAGKRLPTAWEWQFAAQGLDGRMYPWGNSTPAECDGAAGKPCMPKVTVGPKIPGAERVGAHSPQGDSPYGLVDMVGNVWQYTSEFRDPHSRGVILRGSSNYRAGLDGVAGSHWYFPPALKLNSHNKYMLMDDSYERAGTLGFRCAADAQTPCAPEQDAACVRWSGPPLPRPVLSARGVEDWAHFAWQGNSSFIVRAAKGSGAIEDVRPICAGGSFAAAPASDVEFSWTGGTEPAPNASGVSAGLVSACGFEIMTTIRAGGLQTFVVYGGGGAAVSATVGEGKVSEPRVQRPADARANAVFHVSVDAAEGTSIRIRWAPTGQAAPRAPVRNNFTAFSGRVCGGSNGGGTSLGPAKPAPNGTEDGCKALCESDPRCACANFDGKMCELVSECQPSMCALAPGTMSVLFRNYISHQGLNCYGGHGAVNIDQEPVQNSTELSCAERCEADPACTGTQFNTMKKWCWKRKDFDLKLCEQGGSEVFSERPSEAPQFPSLYAVQLVRGPAPELPGYTR